MIRKQWQHCQRLKMRPSTRADGRLRRKRLKYKILLVKEISEFEKGILGGLLIVTYNYEKFLTNNRNRHCPEKCLEKFSVMNVYSERWWNGDTPMVHSEWYTHYKHHLSLMHQCFGRFTVKMMYFSLKVSPSEGHHATTLSLMRLISKIFKIQTQVKIVYKIKNFISLIFLQNGVEMSW